MESRYRAPANLSGLPLTWDAKQGCYQVADALAHLSAAFKQSRQGRVLESIAARARIADASTSESAFRLGVGIGKTSLGFTLSGIEKVGMYSTFDLYCHWFGALVGQAGTDDARYERAVPPVALLHQ